ncbi:hypothetical protein D9M70_644670 [compost metagenome]
MVVVHVGDDGLADVLRLDAEDFQCFDRATQQHAFPRVGGGLIEAGVDQHRAAFATDQPDEVVHRHRQVVGVVDFHEVVTAAAGDMGVA